MIASLYHRGSTSLPAMMPSCGIAWIDSCLLIGGFLYWLASMSSQEIIEIPFRTDLLAQQEDVCCGTRRVQLNEVAGAVPEEALVGEQVVHLEGGSRRDRKLVERQV